MWDYHSNTLLSKLFWRAIGLNASYYNRNTPHFPNHTSRAMKVFIHNWIQDERASRYCYKMRGLFVHKVVPKSSEKWTSHEANSKLFVNIFPSLESCKNILMITNTTAYVQRQNMLVHCPWNYLSYKIPFMLRAKISESLRISVLDLLSYRIPEATGSPTVRWLRIPGKHKPIWRSLYLEMIIKKGCINQLISEKIIRKWERTLSTGTVRLAEKGLNIFKKYWWNFHFHTRSVTN